MEFQSNENHNNKSNENHNNKRVVRSFMELNGLKCVLKQMGYHLIAFIYLHMLG